MSSGALFSNNAVRGVNKNLVEFKAGKMTMKGKMVYPDTRKGLLYVYQSDDSLMHFCWKDRTSGVVEDDLIIFPDDCEFKHVSQCKTGRVYLLRFKLSSKKFFFWLQDLKTEKDDEHCRKINEVLNNPPTPGSHQRNGGPNSEGDLQNILNNMSQQQLMQLFGGVGQIGIESLLGTTRFRPHSTRASTTTASTPVTTTATRPPAAQTPAPTTVTETPRSSSTTPKNSGSKVTSAGTDRTLSLMSDPPLYDLQRRLWDMSTPPGAEPVVQRGIATELTNSIPTAIMATECLERTMSKHLPPGDSLSATLSSPQFSQALSMFWSALQSGQASPIVRQFGMGPDAETAAAAANLEDFVVALENERVLRDDNQPSAQSNAQQPTPDDETKITKKEASGNGDQSAVTEKKDDKKDDKDDEMALD